MDRAKQALVANAWQIATHVIFIYYARLSSTSTTKFSPKKTGPVQAVALAALPAFMQLAANELSLTSR